MPWQGPPQLINATCLFNAHQAYSEMLTRSGSYPVDHQSPFTLKDWHKIVSEWRAKEAQKARKHLAIREVEVTSAAGSQTCYVPPVVIGTSCNASTQCDLLVKSYEDKNCMCSMTDFSDTSKKTLEIAAVASTDTEIDSLKDTAVVPKVTTSEPTLSNSKMKCALATWPQPVSKDEIETTQDLVRSSFLNISTLVTRPAFYLIQIHVHT